MEKPKIEHRPPDKVDVMKVIKIQSLRGNGTKDNPVREIYQYFDMSGEFIFEIDTINYL
ncbi:hypothetical protein [Salinicoccus roseus]|uniref:Uncharacterized protein n=1 Tax=Salinicoccus roseus TaxID=45670 RepID=A0ABT4YK40_9STAP|nr:hypothetical protein [Salinicoccus roseus]MDB0581207.1 hypothetical protein [Salinicoccus roseus]